ncbi:BZ3500_MvSof-1268-A1-R1_Chr4-2g07106 [Microbotryum saponariae]|uniref:BZ3500_MvSof-1268-A1-R1_Chr4-2g07106 protein n=1 Tax=Microbotryum saponariae TaxID=289078 RepID=A0A2X0LIB5_9BASI|nr:BZ3500_MvSof-1268-A1-R1_Chr4-2g07106 [Microbotryum saponariae]SDA06771.1 BZ3501_MvSof-1269-A2-R1_Chr4-2g06817 [Microbotryum saponariae]
MGQHFAMADCQADAKAAEAEAVSVVGAHKHQNLFFTQGQHASGAVEIVDLRCILGSAGRIHRREVGREESRKYIFARSPP